MSNPPNPSPGRLPQLGARLLRYGAVSCVSTAISVVTLGGLVAGHVFAPGWANLVATGIGVIPSFELNRRWVWGQAGRPSIARQVVPFVLLTVAGLALSTVTVVAAARWADTTAVGPTTRTLAIQGANLAGFGTVWVLQFVILDRWLFRHRRPRRAAAPTGDAVPEAAPPHPAAHLDHATAA